MKKICLALFSVILLTACDLGTDEKKEVDKFLKEEQRNKSKIFGAWAFVNSDTQCKEIITFESNGDYKSEALDEVKAGFYVYVHESNSISIGITEDNAMSDCNGISDDDSGETIRFDVVIVDDSQITLSIDGENEKSFFRE